MYGTRQHPGAKRDESEIYRHQKVKQGKYLKNVTINQPIEFIRKQALQSATF